MNLAHRIQFIVQIKISLILFFPQILIFQLSQFASYM